MELMGIADEGAVTIEGQIRVTQDLGWKWIESRFVEIEGFEKGPIHDIPEEAFDQVVAKLEESSVGIYAFGSTICNWQKTVETPFEVTLAEVERTIPRMKRLGTKFVRIMSFKPDDDAGTTPPEVFERVGEVTKRFLDEGLQPVHENCMNHGGMSGQHAEELLEKVPGLKWVFDTANPIFNADRRGEPGSEGRGAVLEGLLIDRGPTVVVKPANMGSSVGVSRAFDSASLDTSLATAATYDEWILVEEAVAGREIEFAVLGGRTPQVSGPGEIRPGDTFYSYADKYETDAAELIDDPDLEPATVVGFQELAARAFVALRCSGMARVDFFLADDGRMLLNEVNTIPGFTSISMYPRLWLKAGLSYRGLIDRLVALAVERHARRRRNTGR